MVDETVDSKDTRGRQFEIYFEDLNEETQKEVLEFYKITTPQEGNYDVFPLFTLEYYSDFDVPAPTEGEEVK